MSRFSEKAVLVTGAARGIGLSIASAFSAEGAEVFIADLNKEAAEAAAAEVSAATGKRVRGLAVDVSDSGSCSSCVGEVVAGCGKIDILVNNAGITKDNLMLRMKEEDFDSVIAVNLKGSFLMSKAAARYMLKARAGSIVSIASVVGQTGQAGQVNYSASKAGIIGMTKSMAREFASRGIRVNAVAPGFVRTPMTAGLSEEHRAEMLSMIPLGREGEPEDIANAVLFLSDDRTSYVTGQVLAVNGGMYM